MLEHVPQWLGEQLRGVRAGARKLAIAQPGLVVDRSLSLASPAFGDGAPIPPRFTADGDGVSPPLAWSGVPAEARSLALIVEDPDAPAPQPLVHAIVWGLDPADGALAEGAIHGEGPAEPGRNSYLASGWLPPDPPTGHGPHCYAFQLFALSERPELSGAPGRSALFDAIRGKVIAAGLLTGTYERGRPAAAAAAPETAAPA